ncbi:EFR1 family ferrodoxin [Clostridiaceae bacterium M8S5]|nr:EFR1 family ferrodoxin [Clostridiaceae bacterium M8S5]
MKSVVIYYFSGTGNTEIVADMFKNEFSKNNYNITLIRIEDVLKNNLKLELEKFEMIGIGSPIIGFGAPSIIYDFIRILPKESSKKIFIFRTAGGVAPINYNASKLMMRKLAKKGYEVFHERVFSISSNWVVKFDDLVIKQLYEVTNKKVGIMCNELIDGKKRILKTGIGLKILAEFAMHSFPYLLRLVGKDLTINKSCSNCGVCIKNCPVNNIYLKNGKIRFKLSCNSCMRCVYSCQTSSINFRFLTFFPVADDYNIKEILNHPYDTTTTSDRPIPSFFDDYVNSDEM